MGHRHSNDCCCDECFERNCKLSETEGNEAMDKAFVVAYMSLFDNDLTLEKVTAKTPEEAIMKHSKLQDPCWEGSGIGGDLETIKLFLFNTDVLANVIQV